MSVSSRCTRGPQANRDVYDSGPSDRHLYCRAPRICKYEDYVALLLLDCAAGSPGQSDRQLPALKHSLLLLALLVPSKQSSSIMFFRNLAITALAGALAASPASCAPQGPGRAGGPPAPPAPPAQDKTTSVSASKTAQWETAYTATAASAVAAAKATAKTRSPVSHVKGKAFDRYVSIWFENTNYAKAQADRKHAHTSSSPEDAMR